MVSHLIIFICILIILLVFDKSNVTKYLSVGASITSIILALVAIGISLIQNITAQIINDQATKTMGIILEKMNTFEHKLDTNDISKITKLNDNVANELTEKVISQISKKTGEDNGPEIKDLISKEISKANEEIKKELEKIKIQYKPTSIGYAGSYVSGFGGSSYGYPHMISINEEGNIVIDKEKGKNISEP
jgi:hypothetical protein